MAEKVIYNVFNEQVILASMMHNSKIRKKLVKQLQSELFIGKRHKIIFEGLQKITRKSLEYNEDTLAQHVNDDFGGFKYLRKLYDSYDENPNIDEHVKILTTDYVKYNIKIKKIKKLEEIIDDPAVDIGQLLSFIDTISKEAKQIVTYDKTLYGEKLAKFYFDDLKDRSEIPIFVPTYLSALDDFLTEGFARKKISVICGRPSMGKTTVAKEIALRQSLHGIKVISFAIEPGIISIMDAMIACKAEITLKRLIRETRDLSNKEKVAIMKAVKETTENEMFHINEDTNNTLDKIASIIDNGNYQVIFIDLFEKLRDVKKDQKLLAEKLDDIQLIAKETNSHICLLQQLRRFGPQVKDKRPTLEQLKNSGGYEEIADLILGLYRDHYYNPEVPDILEIIILKQRRGVLNKVVGFEFDKEYGRLGKGYRNYKPSNNMNDF